MLIQACIWAPVWLVLAIRSRLAHLGHWFWGVWVNHKRRVVASDWQELEFAPKELQFEYATVLSAVKQDWRALEFASDDLKGNKDIVQEAVRQSWRALRFAARGLRADRDLVLGAVKQSNGWALEFAAEELYQDPELVREATSRLGGRLGLPLTPITTLVPVEPELEEPGVVVSGSALVDGSTLPLSSVLATPAATMNMGAGNEASTQTVQPDIPMMSGSSAETQTREHDVQIAQGARQSCPHELEGHSAQLECDEASLTLCHDASTRSHDQLQAAPATAHEVPSNDTSSVVALRSSEKHDQCVPLVVHSRSSGPSQPSELQLSSNTSEPKEPGQRPPHNSKCFHVDQYCATTSSCPSRPSEVDERQSSPGDEVSQVTSEVCECISNEQVRTVAGETHRINQAWTMVDLEDFGDGFFDLTGASVLRWIICQPVLCRHS